MYRIFEYKIKVSQVLDAAKKYAGFEEAFINTHW